MTDMLSVVARAIGAQHCRALDLDPDDWGGLEAGDRLMYRDWAKAAIKAHEKALEEQGLVIVPREPTEAMALNALNKDECLPNANDSTSYYKDVWQAMLAALEGKQ